MLKSEKLKDSNNFLSLWGLTWSFVTKVNSSFLACMLYIAWFPVNSSVWYMFWRWKRFEDNLFSTPRGLTPANQWSSMIRDIICNAVIKKKSRDASSLFIDQCFFSYPLQWCYVVIKSLGNPDLHVATFLLVLKHGDMWSISFILLSRFCIIADK